MALTAFLFVYLFFIKLPALCSSYLEIFGLVLPGQDESDQSHVIEIELRFESYVFAYLYLFWCCVFLNIIFFVDFETFPFCSHRHFYTFEDFALTNKDSMQG